MLCGEYKWLTMEKVSVAIITQNESSSIRQCLEGVRWADEIIVVDNDSTDDTQEICRSFGARVFNEEWKGFARQKNSAIEKTRNEWVLSLDADERIPPELGREIETILTGTPWFEGYRIARRNYFLGRWIRRCGWYPDHNLRLFRKSKGRFEERAVHEKVVVEGRVGTLKNPLEHHTYRSLSDFMKRLERYSGLAALEMRREGRSFRLRDILLRPPLTFFQMYILRAGFLEGYDGFLLSVLYSFYTVLKYSKLKELQEKAHSEHPG
jgi:glycosyltransferase involved in cell wall biosynthesis